MQKRVQHRKILIICYFQGKASDIIIHADEIKRVRSNLNSIYSHHTGQPVEKIADALERDRFMSADEAKEFGIVDRVESHMGYVGGSLKPQRKKYIGPYAKLTLNLALTLLAVANANSCAYQLQLLALATVVHTPHCSVFIHSTLEFYETFEMNEIFEIFLEQFNAVFFINNFLQLGQFM